MYRVQLTDEQHRELKRRSREPGLARRTRDRLEMVRLSANRISVPKIACLLRADEDRVRHWIKAFLSGGFDALPDQGHQGRPSRLTPTIMQAVRQEIAKADRTWNAPQLVEWIAERFGLRMTPDHLGRRLRREKLVYKRTSRSLRHKQKPEEVEAKRKELEELEKRGT